MKSRSTYAYFFRTKKGLVLRIEKVFDDTADSEARGSVDRIREVARRLRAEADLLEHEALKLEQGMNP